MSKFEKGHDLGSQYRWKKGQSGNPGGRTSVAKQVRELAKADALEMYGLLVDKARDGDRVAIVAVLGIAGCTAPTMDEPDQPAPGKPMSDSEILNALTPQGSG